MTKRLFAALTAVLLTTAALNAADTSGTPGTAAEPAANTASVDAAGAATPQNTAPAALEIYFFGGATCGECMRIKAELMEPLKREHGERIAITYHDIDNLMGMGLLESMLEQRGAKINDAQVLFFPDTVIGGFESIMANTRALVTERLNDPRRRMTIDDEAPDSTRALELAKQKFSSMTLWIVISAALIDSVNPCAIATMIFLISFLTVQKRKRSEILAAGLSFTTAVFITYFLIMLGAFLGIEQISQFRWVSLTIKWTAVVFAGGVGVISLLDAVRYKITGKTESVTLKLPKSVKLRINAVITKNMKGKRLILGTFVTGFLVTLLEAVCTGQTVLPTIVVMTQAGYGLAQVTAWLYLILYCLIFVLPLLTVMIAAYYGLKWNQLAKMTQNNLTLLKVLVGIVMIGLATYLALALT